MFESCRGRQSTFFDLDQGVPSSPVPIWLQHEQEPVMNAISKIFAAAIICLPLSASLALAGATVKVTLDDKADGVDMSKSMGLGLGMKGDMSTAIMSVAVDKKEVPHGKVTFEVVNLSKTIVHELIVAPIKDENAVLPYDEKEFKVKEEKSTHLGEVSELDPGKKGALTLDLKAGKYLLYCNVAGHYMDGMWTTIEVK
jgi:uncharacterized cupredoxin-like copper-binding protein